jgi:hypothetical protein
MTELQFIVEEAPEGGFVARAVDAGIFTEADDLQHLHAQIRDAVHCHFDQGQRPNLIRLEARPQGSAQQRGADTPLQRNGATAARPSSPAGGFGAPERRR